MDEKRDRDGAAKVEVGPPRSRQVWEKPTLEVVDVRLTKHRNTAAPDGVFSLS
jgi:hypothetical protein